MGPDARTLLEAPAPPALATGLYRVAPWVLVRTPLLPADSRSLAAEPRRALADPEVVRALAIGSPTLLTEALRDDADARDAARTDQGLARYLIRMSTRPTPYGAFAGVSLARWGPATDVCLGAGRRTRTRPDMAWLQVLLAQWEARPEVRRRLRWRADPLAHEASERLVASGGGSVRATGPARVALAEACGWRPYDELVAALEEATGGTRDQVEGVLGQLRSAGLLRSELSPALTGAEAGSGQDALRLAGLAGVAPEPIAELLAAIAAADAGGAEGAREAFAAVSSRARALSDQTEAFQTDLARDLDGDGLAGDVALECARAAEVLLQLGPGPSVNGDLAGYARRFLGRWGPGREVPIREVFDPVRGLGPMPHTHGAASGFDQSAQARRASRLWALGLEALRDGRRVVELGPAALADLAAWPAQASVGRALSPTTAPDAPLSLDLSAFVVAADAAAVDRGDFLVVVGPNLGAPVAGRWLGRFADLFEEEGAAYYAWLDEAEREAEPGSVPAEVVFVPGSARSANVVVRPTVSEHEIVIGGHGSAPHQVELSDLLVGHDGSRLYVRSRRLGVRLRPTARHMLNHHGAPPVAQFLDAVGQGMAAEFGGFDWGDAERLPVLPRVQVGRAVLAPARWLVSVPGWTPSASVTERQFAEALATARGWGLPDHVYATVADNRLLLDLTRQDDREQLRRELKNSGGALRLTEALPDVGDGWLPGPDGRYLTEIVVSLVRRPGAHRPAGAARASAATAAPATAAPATAGPATTVHAGAARAPAAAPPDAGVGRPGATVRDRLRLPGSDWLFAKFYAPPDHHDRLLVSDLGDLIEMAENSGLARRWFFLRYADPDPHVRVRWQGDPDLLHRHLLPQVTAFAEALADAGRIQRLALDTYDRELDRYGGAAGLEVCETVFHADSVAVRRLLAVPGHDRTTVAVASTVALLAGLGLDQAQRVALYEAQTAAIPDPQVGRAAGDDYRARKAALRAIVGPDVPGAGALADALQGLRAALAPLGEALRAAEASGALDGTRAELWPSLVHMHHNRLVGPGAAPAEPHLLHLLLRTEKGLLLTR